MNTEFILKIMMSICTVLGAQMEGYLHIALLTALTALLWGTLSNSRNAFPSKDWLCCFSLDTGARKSCRREEISAFWGFFSLFIITCSPKFEMQICLPGSCTDILATVLFQVTVIVIFAQWRPRHTLIIFKDQKCLKLFWTSTSFNHL